MVNRWVQPGEALEVSDREEDWRDYFGAYLEPTEEAQDKPKRRKRRATAEIPEETQEDKPEPEPVQPEEVTEEAPGPELGAEDLAGEAVSESELENTAEIDQAEEAPAVEAVPE